MTKLEVDAIANAANTQLVHGGGVAGAIRRAGGPEVQRESDERAPIGLGEAVETTAGDMPARWVIHAATMELGGPTSAEIIERATRSTLAKAEELGARSLALVAFGTGVGGFPLDDAARIMVAAAREHAGRAASGSCSRCTATRPSARSGTPFDACRRWSRPTPSRAPSRRREVAAAIAAGLRSAGREAVELPVADGGEGTLDVLAAALGGELRTLTVTRSARAPGRGRFALLPDGTARRRDRAGERARAGGRERARRVGGLDVRDGRADRGRRRGRGRDGDGDRWRLRDHRRRRRRARGARGGGRRAGAASSVLCDVRVPVRGRPAVFGPQKGADAGDWSSASSGACASWPRAPRDPRGEPMTGAAGGLSGGLWAGIGAQLVPGAPYVLDALGFDAPMRASAFVVTGEGRSTSSRSTARSSARWPPAAGRAA